MRIPELARRLVALVRRDRMAADLADEMRLHVELRAARNRAAGMTTDAATRAARRRFGNAALLQDVARDAWGLRWADALLHDARVARRTFARAPGLAVTAIVTLALGIGVNAAMFSLLDRLLVRAPAGVVRPEQVQRVQVTQTLRSLGPVTFAGVNYPELVDLQAGLAPLAQLAAYAADSLRFGTAPDAPHVPVAMVGAGYFELLGALPARGRAFTVAESVIEVAQPLAVVSDAFWRGPLGGADVLGRTIALGGRPLTVVGIAPPGFTGVDLGRVDVWLPLGNLRSSVYGDVRWHEVRGSTLLSLLVRPHEGVAPATLAARATAAYRAGPEVGGATPRADAVVSFGRLAGAAGPGGPEGEVALSRRLAGVSLAVLLIACANVANLLLVHAVRRRREIAVRLALGISRRRLAAQLLTENALLALAGGAAALLVGYWSAVALRRLLLPDVHWATGPLDWRVACFTLGTVVLVALLTGLAPLLQARTLRLREALKPGERGAGTRRSRLQRALLVLQAALAVLLLSGAGLFVDSLRRIADVDLGYDAQQLVFGSVTFRDAIGREEASGHADERGQGMAEAAQRLRAVPGVAGVALASWAPMRGYAMMTLHVPGLDSVPTVGGTAPSVVAVSPEYFAVTGMRLRRGRLFDASDAGGAPVLLVSETTARAFWPGEDAIGRCVIVQRADSPCRTVVGIVGDAHRMRIVEEPAAQLYEPISVGATGRWGRIMLVARAADGREPLVAAAMRRTLHDVLPSADASAMAMTDVLAPQLRVWRLGATLFSAFGLLALVVAAVGIYGVVSYEAQQRRHELGVRTALGARPGQLLRLTTGQGVRVVGVGVLVGVGLALASGRFVASLLYETSPRDPLVLGVVAAVLLGVAVLASLVPAWRASRVSPLEALRSD